MYVRYHHLSWWSCTRLRESGVPPLLNPNQGSSLNERHCLGSTRSSHNWYPFFDKFSLIWVEYWRIVFYSCWFASTRVIFAFVGSRKFEQVRIFYNLSSTYVDLGMCLLFAYEGLSFSSGPFFDLLWFCFKDLKSYRFLDSRFGFLIVSLPLNLSGFVVYGFSTNWGLSGCSKERHKDVAMES